MSILKSQGPKKKRGLSKKTKTSWRKNTSIKDIEDFIEDQRLEERLGGAFDERKDDDLFVVDTAPPVKDEKRKSLRQARAEKPLKSFQHLTNTSKVPDPVKKRNRRREPEERQNPIVVKKSQELRKNGIVKAKEVLSMKHRAAAKVRNAALVLDRAKRRRTEFDFDLWEAPKDQAVAKVSSDEWLEHSTKTHTLINTGKMQKKVPKDFGAKMSKLPPVEVPHAGTSYNPSLKDHQDLLWKAAMVELTKEKEEHRIDYHTTNMFPTKQEMPTEKSWLQEMSEGVDVLAMKIDTAIEDIPRDENGADASSDSDNVASEMKPKTRKQRRKAKERRAELRKKEAEKSDQLKHQEVFRLKSIKKEIKEREMVTAIRQKRKSAAKDAKMYEPAQLSGHNFLPSEIELKLTDELTGNLRSMKPEGNIIVDRYKSMQKRNIIETTVKHKTVLNKKKRKKVQKRSYKMGFDWEK